MNWRRDRDNWELLGREVEGLEEKRWVMVVGTGVISMILRPLSLDDTCLHPAFQETQPSIARDGTETRA